MATAQPNEGKGETAGRQRLTAILSQARQHLIRKNNAAALALLKDLAGVADCPAEIRLEAAKMLAAAGANAEAALCYLNAGLGLLYDLGDMARARQAFASAHNLDPHNLDVIFHLGQADVVEGRTQDGLAKFVDVLRKSNLKHTPALFEAGCIYQAGGQYDQAILAFKKVLDREKEHIQAIVHMGQLHQIKGMIPEAIGYYLQAAQITREARQLGTTRQVVNMVLALDPNSARARGMLAELDDQNAEEDTEPIRAPKDAAASPAAPVASNAERASQSTPPQNAPEAERVEPSPEHIDVAGQNAKAEAARIQADLERAKADLERTRADLQRAQDERSAAESDVAQMRAQLASAAAEHDATRADIAADRNALEQQALSEIEASVAERREAANAELSSLLRQVEVARGQAADAAAKRDAANAAAVESNAKLAQLERQTTEAERTTKSLRGEVQAEEARLKEAAAQSAQMQNNLNKAKSANEAAMLEIAARRQRAQAELEKAQGDVARLAREKDAERERAELSVSELDRKAEELRREIEAAVGRRKEAESKAAAAQASLDQLDGKVAGAKAKVDTASADLKDLVDQTRTAQANSTDLAARLADLQSAIEAAESKKRVLEDAVGKVKPLAAAADKRREDAEAAAEQADKKRSKHESESRALETRKRELEEAFAKLKSLAASADQRRAGAEAAAEQAEALRAKREADAEALAARVAGLEDSLRDANARVKAKTAEGAALSEVTAKVEEQRASLRELEAQGDQVRHDLETARAELAAVHKRREEADARASARELEAQAAERDAAAAMGAQATAAVVPADTCVESLRTIETLAADGELAIEAATELAGMIHEGRALEALLQARTRANREAEPGPFLLVCGDLCRDLGDIASAREAYRTLALASPAKAHLAQARTSDLFLTFAQRSTAAALARDDAHFAAASDPAKGIEEYADLVARFPEDPGFREELGALHERLGNVSAAVLAYTHAMVGYLGADDVSRAVELAPRLLAAQPADGSAYELAARAYERAGKRADAQRVLDQGLRIYRDRRAAADVERVCRHLADIVDDPVPYRRELAALLHEAGDDAGAAEQLLEAADRLIGWSRGTEAVALLKEAGDYALGDEMVAARINALSARAGDAQQAVDDVARGDLLVAKSQYERAAEAYRRALDENSHHAGAAYRLACLLMDHLHEYENAEQLLQAAAEMRPDHAATRYRLALVKAARGQVVEAVELLVALARFDEANADFIEQFAERLERDAENGAVDAKYRLGIGYRELGRVDEALVILQSIQREHEYVVLCHNAIGLCLRRQGLDTAAAKRFTKAIETPGYPEAQYHEALYNLGELYQAKNTAESLTNALSSFEELYASDCTFKDVGDRIKAVKARMGAVERPKVKRLPTRTADQG